MTIQPQNVGGTQRIVVLYPYGEPRRIKQVSGRVTSSSQLTKKRPIISILKKWRTCSKGLGHACSPDCNLARGRLHRSLSTSSVTNSAPEHRSQGRDSSRHWLHPHYAVPGSDWTRVADALDGFRSDLKGLILDLRGNPGGLLTKRFPPAINF